MTSSRADNHDIKRSGNGAMKRRTRTHAHPMRRPVTRTSGPDSVRLGSKTFEQVCQEMAI
jgi:hypothetical protein